MKTNPILMKGTKGAPIQKNMHPSALKFGPGKKKKEIIYESTGKILPEVTVTAKKTKQKPKE
tara:strand:- start:48 stop:233 length:186 start_codon:yes stop_codon:yes gene_type:complete